jgi:glycosyltransferase involved in cell wall biosynthesis
MPSNPDTRQPHGREGTYLLVVPWPLTAIGGVNQVVAGLYEGVKKFGRLAPRVLQISWEDAAPVDTVDPAGRHITRLRMRFPFDSSWRLGHLVRYIASLPVELLRIRRLVKSHAIRVVNCHYVGGADFSWVLAKRLGLFDGKVLLSLHGLDIRTLARLRGIRRWIWSWAFKHADAIVACSRGLADETMREFGLSQGHVVTIHNGVDASRLEQAVAAAAGGGAMPDVSAPMLLNLGTLEHKKGHDVLLKAFAQVAHRHPTARLQIMGRAGETKEATAKLIADLGLQNRVALMLDVPHQLALRALSSADIFVLSSRNEAFSVALLEAGALGKPVVATEVCGVPELIENGRTGVLVPSEDHEALARGMLALLEDSSRAREYGSRLRERVCSHFTLDSTSRSYLTLAGFMTGQAVTTP